MAKGGVVFLSDWYCNERDGGGQVPSTFVAEVMADAGFDCLVVDLQHGMIDDGDAIHMLTAISTRPHVTPIARYASVEHRWPNAFSENMPSLVYAAFTLTAISTRPHVTPIARHRC